MLKYTTIARIEARLYAGGQIGGGQQRLGQAIFDPATAEAIAMQIEARIDSTLAHRGIKLPLSGSAELVGTEYEGLQTYLQIATIVETQTKAYLDELGYQPSVDKEGSPARNWEPLTNAQIKSLMAMSLPNEKNEDSASEQLSGRPASRVVRKERVVGSEKGDQLIYDPCRFVQSIIRK